MSTVQKHFLRIQILVALNQFAPNKCPERSLFAQMNIVLSAVTESELRTALQWLKDKAYIDFSVEELSEQKLWFITSSGKATLPK